MRPYLYLNNKHQTDIEVTCRVRQGCSGSTTLFLIVTFLIINRLQSSRLGFLGSLIYPAGAVWALGDGDRIRGG